MGPSKQRSGDPYLLSGYSGTPRFWPAGPSKPEGTGPSPGLESPAQSFLRDVWVLPSVDVIFTTDCWNGRPTQRQNVMGYKVRLVSVCRSVWEKVGQWMCVFVYYLLSIFCTFWSKGHILYVCHPAFVCVCVRVLWHMCYASVLWYQCEVCVFYPQETFLRLNLWPVSQQL